MRCVPNTLKYHYFTPVIDKPQLTSQNWTASCFFKVTFIRTQPRSFVCLVSVVAFLQPQLSSYDRDYNSWSLTYYYLAFSKKKFLLPVVDYTSAIIVIIGKLGKKPSFHISQGGSFIELHHRSEYLWGKHYCNRASKFTDGEFSNVHKCYLMEEIKKF